MIAVASLDKQQEQVQPPANLHNRSRMQLHVAASIVLGMLYAILFLPYASTLGLHADDWWDLYLAATRPLTELIHQWPVDYRPFDQLPWRWAVHLFGPALPWYVGAYGVLLWATAITLYAIVYRFTQRSLLALATAALWVVYPADGSVPWLSTTCYRAAALFFLLAVLCLVPRDSIGPWRYSLALLCTACCLGSQELYLGLLALVPTLAAIACPRKTVIARVQYALPFACLIVLYLIYRLWLGPHILHYYDIKSGQYDMRGSHIVKMLSTMLLVIGPEAWQVTFGSSAIPLGSPSVVIWFVGVVGCVSGAATLLFFAGHRWPTSRWATHSQAIRPGIILVGIGLLGVGAGVLPVLPTSFPPTVLGIDTRVNGAADIGAACVTMGLVWILAHSIPLLERRGRLLFVGIAITLTIVPAVRFAGVAQLYSGDWTAQRAFWRQLLIRVPSLRPHTFVVIVASDRAAHDVVCGQIRPWGMNSALSLLYPNSDVHGTVAALANARLNCDHSPVPATNVLVLRYATTPNQLVQPLLGYVTLAPRIRRTSDPGGIVNQHVLAPWRRLVDSQ